MATSKDVEAGQAFITVAARLNLRKGLQAASRQLRAFAVGAGAIGGAIVGGAAAIAAPLARAVQQFASTGDALDKMSGRTGIAVERLSGLIFATEQSGQTAEQFESVIIGMTRQVLNLERGLSTAKFGFGELGLSFSDLKGKSPDQQFSILTDRLSKVEDPTRRAGLAMSVLGRSGRNLLPLISGGAAGLEALTSQADRLGLTLSTKDSKAAAELTDVINVLKNSLRATTVQIGAALAPMLIDLASRVVAVAVMANQWVRENRQLAITIAKVAAGVALAGIVVAGLAAVALGVSVVIGGLVGIVSLAGTVIGVLGTVITAIASPIGIAVAAVAAGVLAFINYTSAGQQLVSFLVEGFFKLFSIVKEIFGGIADALGAGDLQLAGRIAALSLQVAWKSAFAKIKQAAAELWANIQLLFFRGVAPLVQLWLEVTAGLASLFDSAVVKIRTAWQGVSTFIAGVMVRMLGGVQRVIEKLVSLGILTDKASELVKIDVEATLAGLDEDKARFSKRLDDAKANRDEARAQQLEHNVAVLGETIIDLQRQRDNVAAREVDLPESQLRDLRAALAEAKQKRSEGSLVDQLKLQLSEAGRGLAGGSAGGEGSSRGAFSAAGAALLAGGATSEARRTADATERTAIASEATAERLRKEKRGYVT